MLSRGVGKMRLRAQLLWWKTRYRLSSLTVADGTRPQITATVNPTSVVSSAIGKMGSELNILLTRIGYELMSDPAVQAQVRQIAADRPTSVGMGAPARTGQSPAAEAAALEGGFGVEGRPRFARENIEIAPDVVVREQQMFHPTAAGMKVLGIGASGHYDPHVLNAVKQFRTAGLSDAEMQQQMFLLMRGESPTHPALLGDPALRERFGAVTRLVTAVEPGRHGAAHATTFMGLSQVGHQGTTMEQVVTDLNPMSPSGANPASRYARQPLVLKDLSQATAGQALMERERQVTIRYLEMRLAADPALFKTEEECITWIRTKFKDDLLRRLRDAMDLPHPEAAP